MESKKLNEEIISILIEEKKLLFAEKLQLIKTTRKRERMILLRLYKTIFQLIPFIFNIAQ